MFLLFKDYLMKKVPSLSRDAPIEIKESGVGSGKVKILDRLRLGVYAKFIGR